MNSENYTQKLDQVHPLSAGLKAYITTIAQRVDYNKGQKFLIHEKELLYFPLLEMGQANYFAVDNVAEKEFRIGSCHAGDFLPQSARKGGDSRYEIQIEFFDDSSIVGITEKHYSNLMRVFLDAHILNHRFTSLHVEKLVGLFFKNNYR